MRNPTKAPRLPRRGYIYLPDIARDDLYCVCNQCQRLLLVEHGPICIGCDEIRRWRRQRRRKDRNRLARMATSMAASAV